MYRLFIANKNYSSWSLRPWILMKEFNLPFEEILIPFTGEGEFKNELKNLPAGKVPVLHFEDLKIWESLAIIEFLAENHQGIWPLDIKKRALARSLCSEMHSGFSHIRSICSMNCGVRVKLKTFPPGLLKDINRMNHILGECLKSNGGPFLMGENFSAVDAFFSPIAFRMQTYDLNFEPTVQAYFKSLLDRPLMSQWYKSAIGENFRDFEHDNDLLNHGVITSDYRTNC